MKGSLAEKIPTVLKARTGAPFQYVSTTIMRKQWDETTYGDYKNLTTLYKSFVGYAIKITPAQEGRPAVYEAENLDISDHWTWYLHSFVKDGLFPLLFLQSSADATGEASGPSSSEAEIRESILHLLEIYMDFFGSNFKNMHYTTLLLSMIEEKQNQGASILVRRAMPFYLSYMLELQTAIEEIKKRLDDMHPHGMQLFRSTLILMIRRSVYRKEEIVESIFLNLIFYFSTLPMVQKRVVACQILQVLSDSIDSALIVNKQVEIL